MRLMDLGDKEIVNLNNGARHGLLSEAELLFDERSGFIKAILVLEPKGRMGFWSSRDMVQLPWSSIRKIGEDIILFEPPHG